MTIQRLYSLPNCTLLLEGMSNSLTFGEVDSRVPIAMLINAECRLTGYEKPISGGREFLDSLVTAVSQYAQEVLSGLDAVRPPTVGNTALVQLERVSETMHRLRVRSGEDTSSVTQLDLNTVQLFDLVEAIDQLLADAQTLPDLTLNLKPLSRRAVVKKTQTTKQVVPAAIGVSGLAAAAVLFSLLPAPKVEQPENLFPVRGQTTATTGASPKPTGSPTPGSSPSPTASAASPSPSPSAIASPSPTTSPSASASPDGAAALVNAPEITDAAQLATLSKQLQDKLEQNWTNRAAVTQDLSYQVGVRSDGTIAGYKAINPTSLENAGQTPLLNLVSQAGATTDPLARFKVVFTGSGNVAVAPWQQVMTSPISGISEITETAQLEEILPKLRSQINQNWASTPKFQEELIYKVRVKQDGTIVDYNPENEAAARSVQETPLVKLGKPMVDGNAAAVQEPVALFKVVMRPPDGTLEISPWRGWQN